MAKKRKNFRRKSRKYKITWQQVEAEEVFGLKDLTKEQLRQRLLVLNEEANRRLDKWAQAGELKREQLQVTAFKERLGKEKGEYKRYTIKGTPTRKQLMQQIEKRLTSLGGKTSTVEGAAKVKKAKDEVIKRMIKDYTGIDYDNIQGRKPSLRKIGKMLERLRADHRIGAKAQTTGWSQGSPKALIILFTEMIDNPGKDINQLFDDITDWLDDLERKERQQEASARKLFAEASEEP